MKINLGIIFGGKTVEHEVSIISGIQTINNIKKEKYNIIPIYLTKNNEMYIGKDIGKIKSYKNIENLLKNSQRVMPINNGEKVDLIKYPSKFINNILASVDMFFPVVHGTNVEDGTLQGFLKLLNVPFVGCDVLSSALGMDKYYSKIILKEENIPVLDCLTFHNFEYIENKEKVLQKINEKFKFPVIVKPNNLGSSIGIKIANDSDALNDAIENALVFSNKILIEPAIKNLREINCSVMGNIYEQELSLCEEPIAKNEILSYDDKYKGENKTGSKGMASLDRKIPADLTEETKKTIEDYAIKTFKALNCNGVVRIDFLIDKDNNNIYVNEVNTIPGSLSFYLWEPKGILYPDLLDRLITLALNRYREEKQLTFKFDNNILENFHGGLKGGSKGGKGEVK